MKEFQIFGIPIIADFNPPSEEELEEADSNYSQFHHHHQSDTPECEEFEEAMSEAGFWPHANPDGSFTFVPKPAPQAEW